MKPVPEAELDELQARAREDGERARQMELRYLRERDEAWQRATGCTSPEAVEAEGRGP